MGRKKIQITQIVDERNRQVTFVKRKFGLMKKAYELSILCGCEIALIIFNGSNKLYQYASTDMDKVLLKYTEYHQPHESRTNYDIVEALNKKEHRGCDNPDTDPSYVLSPHTGDKYKKINEDFDNMMKSHKLQHFVHGGTGNLAYTPSSGGGGGGGGGETSQALAAATAALADSDGLHCGSDLTQQNGSGPGSGNGFVSSDGGRCIGKILPSKSPPLPPLPPPLNGTSLVATRCKTDLHVVAPQSKATMQTLSLQRVGQSSQPLSTPVVSMAAPTLLYPSISSACSNEFSVSGAELSGFRSSVTAWQQHQLSSLRRRASSFSVSTNHSINIKAEPISPPREHLSQCGYLVHPPDPDPLHPSCSLSGGVMGRSPPDSVGSSCSSQEEQPVGLLGLHSSPDSTTLKRMRMDSWVT